MKIIYTSILILAMTSYASCLIAEVAIITSMGSGASNLDAKTAKKLFLGKTKSVPGMSRVVLVGQTDKSATKAEFTQKVTKKDLGKYKAYWAKMIFSGKAVPPKELESDAEVIAYVASHNDAVGYVNAESVDSRVKIIFKVP